MQSDVRSHTYSCFIAVKKVICIRQFNRLDDLLTKGSNPLFLCLLLKNKSIYCDMDGMYTILYDLQGIDAVQYPADHRGFFYNFLFI